MCWESRIKLNIEIAEDDIPVFKIMSDLEKDCSYYYVSTKWKLGKPQYERNAFCEQNTNRPSFFGVTILSEGLHSYSIDCKIRNGYSKILKEVETKVYYNKRELNYYFSNNLMYAVIPKGTRYVVNEYGEYVSEYLIPTSFKKIIKFPLLFRLYSFIKRLYG